MGKRIVIVGGVAGGMSCAARLKRLDESCEVTVFEKGPDVSYANCGMPYYVGGVISNRSALNVQSAQGLRARYAIEVRTRHEVIRISRSTKRVEVRNLDSGETLEQPYDALVLSPGAVPVIPPIAGADGPQIFTLQGLADMDRIALAAAKGGHACIIGAGFIGLELAENLRRRGLEVSLVEAQDHVLPPMDREMAQPLAEELQRQGIHLYLSETAVAVEDGAHVRLRSGGTIESTFVCLCVGMRPATEFLRDSGIVLGERGHIRVDAQLRTSDPDIYAVGDAVETAHLVTGQPVPVPLAGPASRQGRIAADVICGREDAAYRGSQGTSVVQLFELAAAQTGLSEHQLREAGLEYRRAYLHPMQRPRYYPGAVPVGIKLLFAPSGRVLGAQVTGQDGVEPIINALAQALRANTTVHELEHLELAYSPQWGGAKHPINMAGYVAANILKGDVELVEADNYPDSVFWLDVRMHAEAEGGTIPGATVIPVDELRKHLDELPRDRAIGVFCAVGHRSYIAYRLLKQRGFHARNLNGGYRTWTWFHPREKAVPAAVSAPRPKPAQAPAALATEGEAAKLDISGLTGSGLLVRMKTRMAELNPGAILEVTATDPGFRADAGPWCAHAGHALLEVRTEEDRVIARIAKGEAKAAAEAPGNKTLLCFSQDLDKLMAAFVIANGAAAMGDRVTMFFTFWGLNALRKEAPPSRPKPLLDKLLAKMMPRGAHRTVLSRLHVGGLGTLLMKRVMQQKNVMSLEELLQSARDAGVRLVACSASMEMMGFHADELIDGVEIGGVGAYLGHAGESDVNLFI